MMIAKLFILLLIVDNVGCDFISIQWGEYSKIAKNPVLQPWITEWNICFSGGLYDKNISPKHKQ